MPIVTASLPEVDKSITRPSMIAIVRQLMEITGIPQSTKIAYKGESLSISQEGSEMQAGKTVLLSSNDMLTIEIAEKYSDTTTGQTAVNQPENIPIFYDDALKIVIKPVYIFSEFTINVQYRCKSRTEALAWRDDIKTRSEQMRDINMHVLNFHYSIPIAQMAILKELFRLRESYLGYGDSFDDYLQTHSTSRLTQISDLAGTNLMYAVAENQYRVQGMFDFQGAPEQPTKNGDAGLATAEFTYNVSFAVPKRCSMEYPIMVHNQLLDEKYIPDKVQDPADAPQARSMSLSYMSHFEVPNFQKQFVNPKDTLWLPSKDEFTTRNRVPTTWPLISVLCVIDPSDPTWLVSLDELDELVIDSEVLDFIKRVEYPFLSSPYLSMFLVTHYRFSSLVDHRNVYVTSDLKVKTRKPLDLRAMNRVQINLIDDIKAVHPNALRRMLPFPNVMRKVFAGIGVTQSDIARVNPSLGLNKIFKDLPAVGYSYDDVRKTHVGFNTVGNFFVSANNINRK